MLELPHTLVGAAIATKISQPYLALPLSLASHFITDAFIPHWNPPIYTETQKSGKPSTKTNILIAFDVILSLITGFYVASRVFPNINHFVTIVLSCFVAVLPDLIEAPYFYLNSRSKILKKLLDFQHRHQNRARFWPGMISQLLVIGVCFYLTLSK